ncbi:MAG: hypothetical protein Phog2KO_13210 [Phototrophicaceae bacterium]
MQLSLHPFEYRSPRLQDAIDMYCKVWERDKDNSTVFFRKYTRFPDFLGYVAYVDSQAVGFVMGARSEKGQWWYDKVAKNIGKTHPALDNAWVLIELAVLADYRRHNIGTVLHNHILSKKNYPNALLSTQIDNYPARRFYEAHHWTYLHQGMLFNKGRQKYCIMHRDTRHDS